MQDTKLAFVIISAVLSGIVSGVVSAYYSSMANQEALETQINFLKEDIKLQNDALTDSKVKTGIMDEQLQAMRESLEKKSLVSVKVNAHAPGGPYEALVVYESSINGTKRTLEALESRIVLIKNEITQFDIIITNVGNDIAVINGYGSAEIIVDEDKFHLSARVSNIHPNGTVLDHSIGKILKPNSDSLIIPFWINATSDFAPKGKIFFTVIHDNGINSTASINYKFE
jgi:hypothetical protein